ncbi:arginosuccinate synthase, partial [candidate division WOR-3 bacterium]
IESVQPATKLRFYKGFLKNWDKAPPPEEMKPCSECGYPTTAGICSFCRLKKRVLSEAGS